MSKTLKGTYLWNETVSPPTQEFKIEFSHSAKTNYGTMSISELNIVPRVDSDEIGCAIEYDENIIYQTTTSDYGGWTRGAYRNITFGDGDLEEAVPEGFYTWFIANAKSINNVVELAGAWQWNSSTLSGTDGTHGLSFRENVNAMITSSGSPIQVIQVEEISGESSALNIFYMGVDIGGTGIDSIQSYSGSTYDNEYGHYYGSWLRKGCQTITFNPGTMVSSKFYCWFVVNAQNIELCEINGRWKWNDIPLPHMRDFDKVKISFKSGFTNMKYMLVESDYESFTSDLTYVSSRFEHKAYGVIDQTNQIPRLVGTWRWKFDVSLPSKSFEAEFTNVLCRETDRWPMNKLTVTIVESEYGVESEYRKYCDLYYTGDEKRQIHYGDDPGWSSEEDRVLIFGEEASIKIVDDSITYDEFYNWFTANAERIDDDGNGKAWTQTAYSIIDFGDTTQLVTKDFYDWFTANATKQALVEISGVWNLSGKIYNENDLSFTLDIFEPITFNLHQVNKSYLGMHICNGYNNSIGLTMDLHYCTYSEPVETINNDLICRQDPVGTHWTNQLTNRIIDFGDTPKLVSPEFYKWFTAHAGKFVHKISGTWALKEELLSSPDKPFEYSSDWDSIFTSNGYEYKRLYVGDSGEGLKIEYDDTTVYSNGAWVDDYYRVIGIHGNIPVGDFIYHWFVNNIATEDFLLIEKATLIEMANMIRSKTGKTDKIMVSNLKHEIDKMSKTSNGIVSVSIREIP